MNENHDIFLVANLGSEVTRLLVAKREHNEERTHGAYERACAIVEELTKSTSAGGQSESAILRTILEDLIQPNPVFSIRSETLNAYFLPFAHLVLNIQH